MTELKESLLEVEDVADVGAGAGGVGVVEGAGGELEGLRGGVHREELHPEQDDLMTELCQEEEARRE